MAHRKALDSVTKRKMSFCLSVCPSVGRFAIFGSSAIGHQPLLPSSFSVPLNCFHFDISNGRVKLCRTVGREMITRRLGNRHTAPAHNMISSHYSGRSWEQWVILNFGYHWICFYVSLVLSPEHLSYDSKNPSFLLTRWPQNSGKRENWPTPRRTWKERRDITLPSKARATFDLPYSDEATIACVGFYSCAVALAG